MKNTYLNTFKNGLYLFSYTDTTAFPDQHQTSRLNKS